MKNIFVFADCAAVPGQPSSGEYHHCHGPVGNAGNAPDPSTGYGAVDYNYNIGEYDVTAGQYTAFLNAVAATDTYGLYNSSMSFTNASPNLRLRDNPERLLRQLHVLGG